MSEDHLWGAHGTGYAPARLRLASLVATLLVVAPVAALALAAATSGGAPRAHWLAGAAAIALGAWLLAGVRLARRLRLDDAGVQWHSLRGPRRSAWSGVRAVREVDDEVGLAERVELVTVEGAVQLDLGAFPAPAGEVRRWLRARVPSSVEWAG